MLFDINSVKNMVKELMAEARQNAQASANAGAARWRVKEFSSANTTELIKFFDETDIKQLQTSIVSDKIIIFYC